MAAIMCAPDRRPRLQALRVPAQAIHGGAARAWSHCRFVLLRIHFIPELLTYSVPLFLKRQCDRTLGADRLIPVSNGEAVARSAGSAGCPLFVLEGMGHDVPSVPEYEGRVLDLIEAHARRPSIRSFEANLISSQSNA
jgi:hypothetical protein